MEFRGMYSMSAPPALMVLGNSGLSPLLGIFFQEQTVVAAPDLHMTAHKLSFFQPGHPSQHLTFHQSVQF